MPLLLLIRVGLLVGNHGCWAFFKWHFLRLGFVTGPTPKLLRATNRGPVLGSGTLPVLLIAATRDASVVGCFAVGLPGLLQRSACTAHLFLCYFDRSWFRYNVVFLIVMVHHDHTSIFLVVEK